MADHGERGCPDDFLARAMVARSSSPSAWSASFMAMAIAERIRESLADQGPARTRRSA
ncbi:MAG: hypothetical protein U0794_02470 [Isosphaeraceae bacterium]